MSGDLLGLLMFLATFGLLMAGFPVAFTLSGTALAFAGLGILTGTLDASFLSFMPQRVFGSMTNEVLIALPLFVFMGVMLERSRVAEELLDSMGRLFGPIRGGLGISVILVGTLLAASTGIVGATVVTMGLLSLPTMLRRGYDPSLACGAISAAGTLGQIIPPSIVLILLGDQISNAHQDAQRGLGNFSPEPVSVGDLFAGALLPGLLLVALYILYQLAMAWRRPASSPAIPSGELGDIGPLRTALVIARALIPPIALIVSVLGSILTGVATPTEAAAVGSVGALYLGALRQTDAPGWPVYLGIGGLALMFALSARADLRITRDVIPGADMAAIAAAMAGGLLVLQGTAVSVIRIWRAGILPDVMRATVNITAMVFVILIGAALFSLVFRGFGGDELVHDFLAGLPGGAFAAVVLVMGLMFLLGFFLDFIEIIFVVVPIVAPILLAMGLDPVWLGVMMAMNLQTSFLTPPFGFALFYLRGVAPKQVTTLQIYRGAVPFVVIQIVGLVMLAAFPALATWLPKVVFG